MPTSTLVVYCTCPDLITAEGIANQLVEQGLAACVTLSPPVTSLYTWQGKCEKAQEVLLLIKTSSSRYDDLERSILALHPYELPEIVAVPVERGLKGYLNWVDQCTKADI